MSLTSAENYEATDRPTAKLRAPANWTSVQYVFTHSPDINWYVQSPASGPHRAVVVASLSARRALYLHVCISSKVTWVQHALPSFTQLQQPYGRHTQRAYIASWRRDDVNSKVPVIDWVRTPIPGLVQRVCRHASFSIRSWSSENSRYELTERSLTVRIVFETSSLWIGFNVNPDASTARPYNHL